MYVLFTAYNELVPDFPELGWLSKHDEHSMRIFQRFSEIENVLMALRMDTRRALPVKLGSPIIQQAIVEVKLCFLRDKIFSAKEAEPYIGHLLSNSPYLTGLEKKVSQYKAAVTHLNINIVRVRAKLIKVAKAA